MLELLRVRGRAPWRGIWPALSLVLLAAAGGNPAWADVFPLLNASSVASASRVQTISGPLTDTKVDIAPANPTQPWNGIAFSNVTDAPNSAYGLMSLSFSASTSGLRVFSGGGCTVINAGQNWGSVTLNYFFEAYTAVDAEFVVSLVQHDLPGSAGALLFPFDVRGAVPYRVLGADWGTTATTGRLARGKYLVSAYARIDSTSTSGTSPAFSIDAVFPDVTNPLVTAQPAPQVTPVGSASSFSVGTSGVPAGLSATGTPAFQWRRNLVNLVDGGTISGATTSHLVVSSTAYADSGYYDVLVTDGGIVEPSSLAKLTVVPANTDAGPPGAIAGVEMGSPRPNPAVGRMQVRFALPSAMPAGLDVLDVSGRLVRSLLPYGWQEGGVRTAEWDGSDEGGGRASPGVYFLRLRAGSSQVVRRVVSLGAN